MHLEQRSDGSLLELIVSGAIDNESSLHFREAIDEAVRDGWHRIVVRMQGVQYISSAGISVLVAAKRRLEQLQGHFGLCELTPEVRLVLQQTKLLDRLLCDPELLRAIPQIGDVTRQLSVRIAQEDGLDLQVYTLSKDESLQCRIIGSPRPLFESAYSAEDFCAVEFGKQSFALGLGALGDEPASAAPRAGELMAVAGAAALSPHSRRTLPDYSLSEGEFTPRGQMLYGMQCTGAFSHLIRFDPVVAAEPVALSTLASRCLREARSAVAGVVILAESAGLTGTHLRRSPVAEEAAAAVDRFEFPSIRNWLSLSPDRLYARSLALILGVVGTRASTEAPAALGELLRPVDAEGKLCGHFHAAVFPYRPLKKRTLNLNASVRALFESGAIQDVLHLLRDDRPIFGVGESELLGGACWISPISDVLPAGGSS